MKRREIRRAIRAELERDYWQSGRELYERIKPGRTMHCFKGYVADERRKLHPDIDDTPDPRWVESYTPAPGTDSERASAWIRNDLLRQRWQVSTAVIERCKEAGYGDPEWSQQHWTALVTQARADVDKPLTVQQSAWLRATYGGTMDNKPKRRIRHRRQVGGTARNDPKIDIHAPPPTPGKTDPDNARRFAAEVLRSAIEDADRLLDQLSNAEPSARGTHAKHASAWLQTPAATEVYCGIADIDADDLAEWSRQRHGVPRVSEAERIYWRDQRRTYETARDKERRA